MEDLFDLMEKSQKGIFPEETFEKTEEDEFKGLYEGLFIKESPDKSYFSDD